MKVKIFSVGLMLAVSGLASPASGQFRPDRPDFYEEGQQQIEREIQRLNEKPPENLLTIEGARQKWEEFTLMEGGFTVWMPGVPTEKRQGLQTAAGTLELKGFSSDLPSSSFVVAYGDYPQTAELDNPEAILASARDRLVQEIGGYEVSGDRSISLNNSPGKELNLQNSTTSITFRLYLVKQRLYILAASQQNQGGKADDIEKFLDSFRLLPQPTSNRFISPTS